MQWKMCFFCGEERLPSLRPIISTIGLQSEKHLQVFCSLSLLYGSIFYFSMNATIPCDGHSQIFFSFFTVAPSSKAACPNDVWYEKRHVFSWHTHGISEFWEPPALCSCCDQCFFRCPGSWASSYLSGLGAPTLTPLLCGCRCICPLSSHSPHIVSLFWFIVICSFHPSFPLHSPCCGAIQRESVATRLSTSPSLFQRRHDLCWSRWGSSVAAAASLLGCLPYVFLSISSW